LDLRAIIGSSAEVERAALLDMFPQTAHFESVILLAC